MTHSERVKEKKRMKQLYTVAFITIGCVIINFVTLFKLSGDGVSDLHLRLIIIFAIILPTVAALLFGMYGRRARQNLMSEFKRMFDEKNKRYFRRFYDAVIANDLELARKRFNLIAVRADTYRIFAHGILITLMRMSGTEKNVRDAEERMSKIF